MGNDDLRFDFGNRTQRNEQEPAKLTCALTRLSFGDVRWDGDRRI